MKLPKLKISDGAYAITYKLLHDALFLSLASFVLMLVIEGALPGFVSTRFSMARVAVVIMLLVISIVWIGKKFNLTYPAPKSKGGRLLPALILFAFLLIGNSLLHFTLWENIIITITTLFIFYLIFEIIFSSKKE